MQILPVVVLLRSAFIQMTGFSEKFQSNFLLLPLFLVLVLFFLCINLAAHGKMDGYVGGQKRALAGLPTPTMCYSIREMCSPVAKNLDFMRVCGSVVMNTRTNKKRRVSTRRFLLGSAPVGRTTPFDYGISGRQEFGLRKSRRGAPNLRRISAGGAVRNSGLDQT